MPVRHPELLAPAGNWECVRAAVANGADAVYFGLSRFNARLRADNFSEESLPEVVTYCHRHGVKAYVAFNTLVFTAELEAAADFLRRCSRAGVDAIIVQDLGVVRMARALTPELPLHASTQMTVTSPEGAAFARAQGVDRVVLARELSLRELERFPEDAEVEVFVHGALCVAYSGQCLTSEALGRRSANRGECAQACRMPYTLVVDGAVRDLGDRRYLLSPQDLAAVEEIPALLERGVVSFKIEGRLKTPEYVAAVCQVYRKALDAALAERAFQFGEADRYQLEMAFSRGLYSGWMHGVNHQELVAGRFGKKRGALAGEVASVGRDFVALTPRVPLQPGDGVVFDTGGDTETEQGGRLYAVERGRLFFKRGQIDFSRIKPGDRVWKTSDPVLDKRLRNSFAGEPAANRRAMPLTLRVSGRAGQPLRLEGRLPEDGATAVVVHSARPLEAARTAPLSSEKLEHHLGRFGDSGYSLGRLENALEGEVLLPIAELNHLRRELVTQLDAARHRVRPEVGMQVRDLLPVKAPTDSPDRPCELRVLCRTQAQFEAALQAGIREIYLDFEDVRRFRDAVALARDSGRGAAIFLATPRIQKPGEQGFFRHLEQAAPDGVLIRNLGAVEHFRGSPLRLVGDFSLNVANPLSAQCFQEQGLERVTISYDLAAGQVLDLLAAAPPGWFELTLHQHLPMFHMEHCVFAAFLSKGTTFLDCGRPCERHRVQLRDRTGVEHPLRADVGCRNTLFNAVAQTGAEFFQEFHAAGLRDFRVELLEEDAAESTRTIQAYQALLRGDQDGGQAWRALKAAAQLGVTRGTLAE